MQAGEGMLTQVEGTDCGKELKGGRGIRRTEKSRVAEVQAVRGMGQQNWRKAQKNLSGSGCL